MRALAIAACVAACSYPKPPDRCDGQCQLFAADRQLVPAGQLLTLEGSFEDGAVVVFPGDQFQPLASHGPRRATVNVPAEATAGELAIKWRDGTTSDRVPFRRPSFAIALQPFTTEGDTDTRAVRPAIDRRNHAALAIGHRVYLIGGATDNSVLDSVDVMLGGLDGTLGMPVASTPLVVARSHHAAVRIGNHVYVLGGVGTSAGGTVERAPIEASGTLGAFELVPDVRLTTARSRFAAAVIGSYLYALGGEDATGTALATIERAPIYDDSSLGTFEAVADVQLMTPRAGFTTALVGSKLFAIGGAAQGQALASVEVSDLFPDGFVGAFGDAGTLAQARHDHASIVLGDRVYVIGGANGSETLDTVETSTVPDGNALAFEPAGPLFAPRQGAALAVVGNHVVVLGGFRQGGGAVTQVERASFVDVASLGAFVLDAATTLVAPRSHHATVVIGNRLYVIGGRNNNTGNSTERSIEVATIHPDGSLGAFALSPAQLTTPRSGAAAFVAGNKLYVAGGNDDAITVDTIERFDIASDGELGAGTLVGTMKLAVPRRELATAVAGERVYLINGAPTGSVSTIEIALFVDGALTSLSTASQTVQQRSGHAAAVLGRALYVFGGAAASTYPGIEHISLLPTGELGTPSVDTLALTRPREGLALARAGSHLYVLGGFDRSGFAAVADRAVISAAGTPAPFVADLGVTLLTARAYGSSVALGDRVYVIGGRTAESIALGSLEYTTVR